MAGIARRSSAATSELTCDEKTRTHPESKVNNRFRDEPWKSYEVVNADAARAPSARGNIVVRVRDTVVDADLTAEPLIDKFE